MCRYTCFFCCVEKDEEPKIVTTPHPSAEVIKTLIDLGADASLLTSIEDKMTCWVASRNQDKFRQLQQEQGVDNMKNIVNMKRINMPLHYTLARIYGDDACDMADFLVEEMGADPNLPDQRKHKPLGNYSWKKKLTLIKNVYSVQNTLFTIIHLCVIFLLL